MTRKIELKIDAQPAPNDSKVVLVLRNGAEFAFHPQFGVRYLPQGGHGPIQTGDVHVTKTEINLEYGPSGRVIFRLGLLVPHGAHQLSFHSEVSRGSNLIIQIDDVQTVVQDGSQSPTEDHIVDLP